MKKPVLFLLVILLMIGVCGCGMKGQAKVDRMLSYINEKYTDDSFEFVSMAGGHLGSNVTKIIVRSEKYPEKSIRVICTMTDGVEVFSDTYLHHKFEEQTRAYLAKVLSEAYGNNFYLEYFAADVAVEDGGTSQTTFEEYLANEKIFISFFAMVCSDVTDENAALEKVQSLFQDAVLCGDIYFVAGDAKLDAAEVKQRIKDKNYTKRLFFVKKNLNDYSKTEWTDGK